MHLYGLKNCDNCRKALKSLPEATFFDVRNDGIERDVLDQAYAQFGSALVNTRSSTWRSLTEDQRNRPEIDLLLEHPTLMKRPLIVTNDSFYIGWTIDVQQALGVT